MNKKGKAWHLYLVAVLIAVFSVTAIFGVSYQYGDTKNVYIKGAADIRFGIDIRGGVDVTFMPADGQDATDDQMTAAKTVIEDRLVGLGITDYEDYVDYNKDRIIVRFPWKSDESDFNPQTAIDEIGTTAEMVFRKGSTADGEVILTGDDVTSATPGYDSQQGYVVQLEFSTEGAKAFGEATTELAPDNGVISIWLDGVNISTATVQSAITDGRAIIEGSFTQEDVTTLSNQINSGALPFALSAESYSTISPTLGAKSLEVMVIAGVIAFVAVAFLMIFNYRLPGAIATLSLLGQVAATLAVVSGYFTVFPSSTLTLPGIAGIILGIGMGVDANVITAERIREELAKGKTLDGAIASGFKMGLTPIIDGNVTIVIVAAILMGAFGPTDGLWAKVLYPIFFWFGPSTAGTVYSFGFTLLTSVLLNFVFGVAATRVMIRGASKCKALRNPVLYGGAKQGGAPAHKVPAINFVGNRKKFYTFSCALIAVVLVFSAVFGVTMDVEFKGGSMITLGYEGEADLDALKTTIGESVGQSNLTLQTGEDIMGSQTLTVTLPGSETVTTEQLDSLLNDLNAQYPGNAFVQNQVSNVNPTIGKEFLFKSIVAVAAACVLILLYVAYRFRKIGGLSAGAMAVVALLHDMFVVYGVFVLLRIPLNGNFIAAMLTILGYSINDTVVIYDRIRENTALYGKKMPLDQLVNLSVNQSFSRSLMTSITTCVALAVVCVVALVFKLDSIFTFAFPLLFGMVSGVYSTICIATQLWVDWKLRKKPSAPKKA